MNRFDRILGILLYLRSRKYVSATELAERFEVSRRTIYRDVETLSLLGVPIYAERGRGGGFRLLEGYFLPPLMFSTTEAVSLLLGLTFMGNLRVKLFEAELKTAEQKLLTAVPDRLRTILEDTRQIIGFEDVTGDAFHPEPPDLQPDLDLGEEPAEVLQSQIITLFSQAILDRKAVKLQYYSPYRDQIKNFEAEPFGLFWDRNRWYLVGKQRELDTDNALRVWRADRVLEIKLSGLTLLARTPFDIQALLGHNWLKSAMEIWRQEAPVKIRLTLIQSKRLQQDWYYRHAKFESMDEGYVLMTFGEDNCQVVLELLRWLGPGAELIEPTEWRQRMRDELQQMLATYAVDG